MAATRVTVAIRMTTRNRKRKSTFRTRPKRLKTLFLREKRGADAVFAIPTPVHFLNGTHPSRADGTVADRTDESCTSDLCRRRTLAPPRHWRRFSLAEGRCDVYHTRGRQCAPRAFFTSSVRAGRIWKRSPTTPRSATRKMGASGSLLMATMCFEDDIPARC